MSKPSTRRSRSGALVFEIWNYVLLIIGVALISVGFAAMYIESVYLGPISLYVAPVLIVGGYAEIIYALMWTPDEDEASQEA